ncbi:glutathione S-transferase family protein [bacterium]|nr:glutathione S-transferase family protein [bacterium]
MITLYQFPRAWGLPNGSPFCQKVEAYMRFAKLEYQTKLYDPRKAPKSKLPLIDDNGTLVADSFFILEYLDKTYQVSLNEHLSSEQIAIGNFVERSLEEHLYWKGIYLRWVPEENFQITKEAFFKNLKGWKGLIIPTLVRKTLIKRLQAQGTLKHNPSENDHMAFKVLSSLSHFIGEKKYLFGEQISSFDASAWSFITALISTPHSTKLKEPQKDLPNLGRYAKTIRDEFFPDYNEMQF